MAAQARQAGPVQKGNPMKEVEFKAPRSVPEIQAEYNQLAGAAGDLSFQLAQNEENLQRVHEGMAILHKEARMAQQKAEAEAKLKAAEEKAKAEAEAKAKVETVTPVEALPVAPTEVSPETAPAPAN